MKLELERRVTKNETDEIKVSGGVVLIAPALDEDYWTYRVVLSDHQAILGFPKFTTIGVGFAEEDDWNTNLPYSVGAEGIWEHIKHNKGDDSISDEDCIAAIEMVVAAAREDRGENRE